MRTLLAAFACLALTTPAFAEVEDAAITGRWSFTAESFFAFGVTQEIGGEMELTRTGENSFVCTLSVFDRIPEENVTIRAEQTCVATREGDTLNIVSTVISIDPNTYNYVPDNFILTIESGSRMTGVMLAGAGEVMPEAVFTRGGALLS